MNPALRTIALFVGLLALVVVVALLMVKYTGERRGGEADVDPAPLNMSPGESAVSVHPDLQAGLDAVRDNRLEEASESFAKVPEGDPGYANALSNLAAIQLQLGELQGSWMTLMQLSALQPDNPDVYAAIGWVLYLLGRNAEAEMAALRAIELDDNHVAARYNVALYRLVQNRLPEAIKAYHRAMSRDGAMQYVGAAREHLVELQRNRPEFAEVHYALAYFANAVSNTEMEIEELEKYLALNPGGPAVEVARSRLAEAKEASRR
jgi:tetratricopeptide (TPR) repeat protein